METFFLYVMLATSVVGLTFIIERGVSLRWNKVVPSDIVTAADACRSSADLPTLHRICQKSNSALARLLLVADEHMDLPECANCLLDQARQVLL